jgi:hypothetical protein
VKTVLSKILVEDRTKGMNQNDIANDYLGAAVCFQLVSIRTDFNEGASSTLPSKPDT